MSAITLAVTVYLFYVGWDFYSLPLEERFYHPRYDWYKASGILGHGLGIIGTAMILFGVVMYITAKKYGYLDRFIRLKYLLEFHIFLCTLGPILVLFHTTFKFGGIVSVAFWSMVVVVLSGVVGRYLYLQIPRSISGRALSVQEVQAEHNALLGQMSNSNVSVDSRELKKLRSKERKLQRRMDRLQTTMKYFGYWHVIHRPFALIMLVIVIIHVGVTLALGYKWIF